MSLLQYTRHFVLASTFLTTLACQGPTASDKHAHAKATDQSQQGIVQLQVSSMTCQKCARGIESYLSQKPGVISVQADNKTGAVTIQYNSTLTNPTTLREHLLETGHKLVG